MRDDLKQRRKDQSLYHFTIGALPLMQKRGRQAGKRAALRVLIPKKAESFFDRIIFIKVFMILLVDQL